MAYSTGISSTIADLIGAVRTFAVQQGFTASPTWTTPNGWTVMALSKAGVFYHIAFNANWIMLNTATASNGAGEPQSQPGANPSNQVVGQATGPHVGYHLFSQGDRVHCVVERATNVFLHMSFGQIEKAGNWAGGAYVTGACWSDAIYPGTTGKFPWTDYPHSRPFESITGYTAGANINGVFYSARGHMRTDYDTYKTMELTTGSYRSSTDLNCGFCSSWGYGFELLTDSPNMFNNRAALVPIQFTLQSEPLANNEQNTSRLQMGQVTDVAAVNMALINPKDIINNDWMVFPISQKNGDGITYVNSGNYGLAYKK